MNKKHWTTLKTSDPAKFVRRIAGQSAVKYAVDKWLRSFAK